MKTSPMTIKDVAAAIGVVIIWGLNFVAMKLSLHDLTPMQLGAARYFFAAIPLVFFIRPPAVPWKRILLYGLIQGLGQFGLLFLALRLGMTAALASVLMQTQVFFTALLAYFLLNEKLSRLLIGGLFFAAMGLTCFLMNFTGLGFVESAGITIAGFALNLCAAAMWGGSNILVKQLQHISPNYNALQFVVWASLVPILPFLLLSWWMDPAEAQANWRNASWTAWMGAAYLGLVATIVAYSMWTGLLMRHPATKVAPFSLGVPVVGLMAGTVVLGEKITAWQWLGILFILASLLYVLLGGRLVAMHSRSMALLRDDGERLVQTGVTSREELLRVTRD